MYFNYIDPRPQETLDSTRVPTGKAQYQLKQLLVELGANLHNGTLLIPLGMDHEGVPLLGITTKAEKQACVSYAPDTSCPSLIVLTYISSQHTPPQTNPTFWGEKTQVLKSHNTSTFCCTPLVACFYKWEEWDNSKTVCSLKIFQIFLQSLLLMSDY